MGCNCGGGRRLTTPAARPVSVSPSQSPAQAVPARVGAVSAGYAKTMNSAPAVKVAAPVKRSTV